MNHPTKQTLFRNEYTPSVGANDTVAVGGNMNRHAIIIGAPPTATIYVRFGSIAADGLGLPVYAKNEPLYLTEGHVGNAIREDIHIISPGGVQTLYILEIFCPCALEG